METPELAVNDHVILRPINRRILPEVMSAYLEDPQAAKAALPWLKEGEEARRQIADLMIDLELHRNGDSIHFWAIHSMEDNSFVGMIGLGDDSDNESGGFGGNDVDGILRPEEVADCIVEGIEKKRFLILPHPDVAKYMERKANNRERWIAGMQRFRQSVTGQTD